MPARPKVTVAIDVDTRELRSPSKSPAKSLSIRERLEHWQPVSPSTTNLNGKLERASKRRHKALQSRAASAAARNGTAARTAEWTLAERKAHMQEAEQALQANLLSAEQRALQVVEKRSKAAKMHLQHAKRIADSQRAMRDILLREKRQSVERRLAMAEAKQMLKAQRAMYKASARQAAAEAKAAKLKDNLEAQKSAADTKLQAAESRMQDMTVAKLTKLVEHSDHAKQVRKNKGSANSRATELAEQAMASDAQPVTFEVDIKTKPSSPKKSPVQIRLEQRREEAWPIDMTTMDVDVARPQGGNSVDSGNDGARRRLDLLDQKKKALSTKHERISAVVKRKLCDDETEKQATEAKHAARHAAAETRRNLRLKAMMSKASSHLERANEISTTVKDAHASQQSAKMKSITQQLAMAAKRHSKAIQAKGAKGAAFASPWSPARSAVAGC